MAVVARYVWGKTEKGYGWHLWEGCGLSIERDGKTGYWGVHEKDGSQLCICVDYRSAQKVVGRLRRAELSRLIPDSGKDFAILEETKEGWTYNGYSSLSDLLCGSGKTFATREEAEAYIVRKGTHPEGVTPAHQRARREPPCGLVCAWPYPAFYHALPRGATSL